MKPKKLAAVNGKNLEAYAPKFTELPLALLTGTAISSFFYVVIDAARDIRKLRTFL